MKLILGLPLYRQPEAKFMVCLTRMAIMTARATVKGASGGIDLDVRDRSSSVLWASRTAIWQDALEADADYLAYLDFDHTFPPHALGLLLSRNLPVVAANYRTRGEEVGGAAVGLDGKELFSTTEKAKAPPEEVSVTPLGLSLINMRVVVPALQAAAKAQGRESYYPLFAAPVMADGINAMTEDHFFSAQLRNAGVKMYIDHALSMDVGHIHEQVLAFPK